MRKAEWLLDLSSRILILDIQLMETFEFLGILVSTIWKV